jgi:predicted nucleic-acid-binding protein
VFSEKESGAKTDREALARVLETIIADYDISPDAADKLRTLIA